MFIFNLSNLYIYEKNLEDLIKKSPYNFEKKNKIERKREKETSTNKSNEWWTNKVRQ